LSNGTVTKSVNGGAATVLYTWIVNGVAADFQFRPFNLTGDTANLTGSAFNSFIAPPLTFTVTNASDTAGTKGVDFSLDVRRVVGSVLLDTTTVSMDATVTPPAPTANLDPISQSAATTSPTDATVLITVATDGFVKASINGGASVNLYQWLLTGTAADFQFQGSAATGDTGNILGTAFGSYFAAPVSWTLTNSDNATSTKTVDFTLSVRRIPDNTVLDTTTVHMVAGVTLLPNADLQAVNQSALNTSPNTASVGIVAATDGFIKLSTNGSAFANLYSYIVNGVAADFQFRASNVTGDAGNLSGSINVWQTAVIGWTLNNTDLTATTKNVSFTLEIRRTSDQVVLDTVTVTFAAQVQVLPNADLQQLTVPSSAVSPANASSKITVSADGNVYSDVNGGGDNLEFVWRQSGVNTDFQFQASSLGGSNPGDVTGSAFNTWLTAPVSWTLTNSDDAAGTKDANWFMEVRRTAGGTVIDSSSFAVTAQVTPGATNIPALLFGAGELGFWFDASDMSTLWQDSAGATPVTAVEQPVGRWADKSGRGIIATQATAASRPIWSARKNFLQLSENFNNSYWTKVGCTVDIGGLNITETSANSAHSIARAAVLAATPGPTAGYTLTSAFIVTPDGRTKCSLMIANGATSRFYRVMFDLTGAGAVIGTPENTGALTNVANSITNIGGQYHISVTAQFPAETGGVGTTLYAVNDTPAIAYIGSAGLVALTVEKGQFEYGNVSTLNGPAGNITTGYQYSEAAAVYDYAGFPKYLRFDGTDDFMVTTVINLTATNKVTSWAGALKLSDNSQAVIFEWSNSTVSNAGVFGFVCPLTSGPNILWRSRGTTTADATLTSGFASPIQIVATGESDIAAPLSRVRANGQTTSTVTTQGTGNFGNFAAYIARRGGTTNQYTGGIHQLIVRGAATTLADIQTTEQFIAGKVGITLP